MPFLIMILLAEKFELIHLSILIPITDFLLEFVIVVFFVTFCVPWGPSRIEHFVNDPSVKLLRLYYKVSEPGSFENPLFEVCLLCTYLTFPL